MDLPEVLEKYIRTFIHKPSRSKRRCKAYSLKGKKNVVQEYRKKMLFKYTKVFVLIIIH